MGHPLHVINSTFDLPNAVPEVVLQCRGGMMAFQEIGVHSSYRYGDNGWPDLPPMGYSATGYVIGKYMQGNQTIQALLSGGNCKTDAFIKLGNGEKWSGTAWLTYSGFEGEHDTDNPGESFARIAIRFRGKPVVEPVNTGGA